MRGSFWVNVLKGFLIICFVVGITVDIAYRGLSWSQGAMWLLTGMIAYGLYRFYSRGQAVRSAYHERWNRVFERDASD